MTRKLLPLLFASLLLAAPAIAAEHKKFTPPKPTGPAYIKVDGGWQGYWPHGKEYAEFLLAGNEPKLQDAYHIMLRPGMGMMLTFASQKDFAQGDNLLEAHKQWELAYWRKNAPDVKDANRPDLAGGRSDMLVTEITLAQQGGEALRVYMAGVAAPDGVYVFSISPVTAADDDMIRKLLASIRVVKKELDLVAESKRIMDESKANKKTR